MALDTDRAVVLAARQQARLRKAMQQKTAEDNISLATSQRQLHTQRNTQFTSNTPTEAFFDQFNRSTR
jgi:hypothetical protein